MVNKAFLQENFWDKLSHAMQECGEFIAAAGKTSIFGLDGFNPLLPPDQQEKNRDWVLREAKDAIFTLNRVIEHLEGNSVSDNKE